MRDLEQLLRLGVNPDDAEYPGRAPNRNTIVQAACIR